MAVIRRNVVEDKVARDGYIEGVRRLKQEMPGPTTADLPKDLPVIGPTVALSTYDLFVAAHYVAMMTATPKGHPSRNAAHRGPTFLPWHRFMLIVLELHLQRVLDDADFALPYWDWTVEGAMPPDQQRNGPIWQDDVMGGDGSPPSGTVTTGPFSEASGFRVRIASDPFDPELPINLFVEEPPRALQRVFSSELALPTASQLQAALRESVYDTEQWDSESSGFRSHLEGLNPRGLHNLVHGWVGGDMRQATSPNDPVFFLHHCNVDRIWAGW